MFQAYSVYIQDTSWQEYTQLSTMSFAHITPGSSGSDSQLPKQILWKEDHGLCINNIKLGSDKVLSELQVLYYTSIYQPRTF